MVSEGFGGPEGLVPRPGGRSRPDDEVGFEVVCGPKGRTPSSFGFKRCRIKF